MNRHLCCAAVALLAAVTAGAQEFGWPPSVVCALGAPMICTEERCRPTTLDALDVPSMIRLDLLEGAMLAVTPEHLGRTSTFKVIERSEARIVMQGFENGRAFSAILDEDGTLAISATSPATNFSVFARCANLQAVNEAGK